MTVKMPRVSDTVDTVIVVKWMVSVGDTIDAGTPLVSVDADKAVVEVPAPVAGRIVELLAAQEDEIETGSPLVVLEY